MNQCWKTNDIFTMPWADHNAYYTKTVCHITGSLSARSPPLPRGGSNPAFTGLKRSKREISHLHCLWWLPNQATCLCLLQRLRPSHPSVCPCAEASCNPGQLSLLIPPARNPEERSGCGSCNTAVQMKTAACISGRNSRDTFTQQLFFSELLPGSCLGSPEWKWDFKQINVPNYCVRSR